MVAKTTIVRYATACLLVCCFVFSGQQAFAQRDAVPTDEAIITQGEQLFNEYQCNTCHKVETKLVGPALAGVYDRRSLDWIYAWVKNSQALIASGDAQANELWKQYQPAAMTPYDLENEQILAIMAYVRNVEENPPAQQAAVATGDAAGAEGGTGIPASYLNIIVAALIVVLVLILIVLGLIVSVLKKYLQDKETLTDEDKEIVNEKFSLLAFFKSPTVIGIITFLVIALAAKNVIDGLYTIGVQQGYAPKQPIAFSHKIHAGQYEIACQYCHTGVEIGKSANIPSVNICMNCHSAIKTESPEIQKLYAAQESGEPIEWVRIHNLPDLAYFNHSQHVKVGEIACQTCHGEIQEMEVVKQHAPLTMGWCIDCHRNTSLNTQGNGYYDKLVELHNKNSGTPMKVADIGGLECAKCHY
ncbi:MAG TPA: c-type cytochrome [Roseivirga sp.]